MNDTTDQHFHDLRLVHEANVRQVHDYLITVGLQYCDKLLAPDGPTPFSPAAVAYRRKRSAAFWLLRSHVDLSWLVWDWVKRRQWYSPDEEALSDGQCQHIARALIDAKAYDPTFSPIH